MQLPVAARHRAPSSSAQVCPGSSPRFGPALQVCPYHAWALDGDGVLRDVPVRHIKGWLLPFKVS